MTVPLDGIDLVIFDKDGTLIEFDSMWSSWAVALADGLAVATGKAVAAPLYAMLGYDPASGEVLPSGGLAATPMSRLHDRTRDVLMATGLTADAADRALAVAWHAPDPVGSAHALADLHGLFETLHASGRHVAVATTDDREPTTRTLAALEIADEIDGFVCADDGVAVKPAPDMVIHLCRAIGIPPTRTAVVGDSAADMRMARAAGAGLAIGVLTGVGGQADLEPLADVVIDSVARLLDEDS